MTVAIGMVCSDGVLVASDSQATSGTTAAHGNKVYTVKNARAIWTAAGAVYTIEEVSAELDNEIAPRIVSGGDDSLKSAFAGPETHILRHDVGNAIRQAMQRAYSSILPGFVPAPSARPHHPFAASFLLLGVGENESYFLEVAADGQLNWHTQDRFYAVGSGGEFATVAMALLAHYLDSAPVPLEHGMKLAYRAIETTCRVSSGLVGLPVQMAMADSCGARILGADELSEVEISVNGWKELEKNTLHMDVSDDVVSHPLPEIEDGDTQ